MKFFLQRVQFGDTVCGNQSVELRINFKSTGKGVCMKRFVVLTLLVLACLACQLSATAYVYVGSWQVDQGPYWPTVPPAYTGQEAAALLFGGSPSQYAISTMGTNPGLIDFSNWVSTWGGACGGTFPCGTIVAENFVVTTNGFYEFPGDTSAYVLDWAQGAQYTNYAFKPVPEPGSLVLFGSGALGLVGLVRRKLML
jgi:PEP-CTERM motif